MTDSTALTDIHDWVNELTTWHSHRETYTQRQGTTSITAGHVTHVPPLIHQLLHAGAASTGEGGTGGYASRPAGNLESVATLVRIDIAAARWVRDLGEDDPGDKLDKHTGLPIHGSGTIACIQLLHALHASAEQPAQRAIERDIKRWWTAARIVTGWDSPAWRPDNTCPACDRRGGLRIRLSASSALCIECHETWDDTTLGLLAEHIRAENRDDDTTYAEGA